MSKRELIRAEEVENKIIQSSLVRSAGIYTFSNIVNASIPFLLLPILTRYLSPSDYGILTMFQTLAGIITPFIGLGLQGSISRKFYDRENIDFPRYFGNCILVLIASIIVISLVYLFFNKPIAGTFLIPAVWVWLSLIIVSGQFLISVFLIILQLQAKALLYGIYQVSQTAVSVALSIWFVVFMGMSWKGSIMGQVIAISIFGFASTLYLWKSGWIKFSPEYSYLLHAVKFGVFLIPHSLGAIIFGYTDRFFVAKLIGISDAGLYAVGYQVGMIIALLQNSFNQAWVPWLYERLSNGKKDAKIKIVRLIYFYDVIILVLAIGLSLIAPWFLNIFIGKDFGGAKEYVFWIALGYAFNGMYKMVAAFIFYEEKTYILSLITVLIAIINIFLNYLLIQVNGTVGAAIATAITFLLSFILTWTASKKVYKMPWLQGLGIRRRYLSGN